MSDKTDELKPEISEESLPDESTVIDKSSYKKLPAIFKKEYTGKKFSNKILKKIYIPQDREFVQSLFTVVTEKRKKEFLSVDSEIQLPKKDLSRLRTIAKAIKKNKSRVKFLPLIVISGIIIVLATLIMIFKNPLAKKAIKYGCEFMFGAKTDVGSVKVELMGISLKIDNLAVGDKNSPGYMKNLFEVESIVTDINFTQALRGKVLINEVSVNGMKFGTDRTTSCYLPEMEKKKEDLETAFVNELRNRFDKTLEDLRKQAAAIAGGDSIEEIVGNIQSQLKTPDTARRTQEEVQSMIEKWKSKPAEFKPKIEEFSNSVKTVKDFDIKSIKYGTEEERKAKLREYLLLINDIIKRGNVLKNDFEGTYKEVKIDAIKTKDMAKEMSEAVKSDKALAESIVDSAVKTVANAREILSSALNTIGYDMLGKYYGYIQKGISYAKFVKESSETYEQKYAKKVEGIKKLTGKTKKAIIRERLPGTTFWYASDAPKVWIKKFSASGYTENDGSKGFSGTIKNITSDQNFINQPTTIEAVFDVKNVNHSGKITLDVRKNTKADLIAVDYKGKGFAADINGSSIANLSGVPSIKGTAEISLFGSAGETGFAARGQVALNPVSLTSDGFPNPIATKYYNIALGAITNLFFGYNFSYRNNSGADLAIDGNFSEQFEVALKAALTSAAKDAKDAAIAKLNELINNSENEVLAKIKEFAGIEGDIDIQNFDLDTMRNILEEKKKEIETALSEKVEEVKEKAKEEVVTATKTETEKVREKTNEAIKTGAANLLNKLKK